MIAPYLSGPLIFSLERFCVLCSRQTNGQAASILLQNLVLKNEDRLKGEPIRHPKLRLTVSIRLAGWRLMIGACICSNIVNV